MSNDRIVYQSEYEKMTTLEVARHIKYAIKSIEECFPNPIDEDDKAATLRHDVLHHMPLNDYDLRTKIFGVVRTTSNHKLEGIVKISHESNVAPHEAYLMSAVFPLFDRRYDQVATDADIRSAQINLARMLK